jgi:hypothetical protein
LQDTPLYVRKVFAQIQSMKRAKANQESDLAATRARHPGMEVIRHG